MREEVLTMLNLSERAKVAVENQSRVYRIKKLVTELSVDSDETKFGIGREDKKDLLTECDRLFQTTAIVLGEEIPTPEE